MATETNISTVQDRAFPSDMRDMGFSLFDRAGCLWWERQHPTIPELRFVVEANRAGIVRLPAECMSLHGEEDGESVSSILFAGFCNIEQIRTTSDELCAMDQNAVRMMLLALARK